MEQWADRIFAQSDRLADLLIGLAFQVVHPHDARFARVQTQHQVFDLFGVFDSLKFAVYLRWRGVTVGGTIDGVSVGQVSATQRAPRGRCRGVVSWYRRIGSQATDHNASSDDRQVCRERALASKAAKHGEIMPDVDQEHFRNHVVSGGFVHRQATAHRGPIDDMDDQANKSIDEVLPRPGFPVEATLQ